jgi:16S rRNA (guanine527-N7)-methyltransferase
VIDRIREACGRDVSRETFARLEAYVDLLIAGAETQNLIGKSTVSALWERHVVDSAQLLRFAPGSGTWVDIGSGAGLPGLVIAILADRHVTLNEPRRLRAGFLQECVDALELGGRVTVADCSAAALTGRFDVISARAVGSVAKLFEMARHLSHSGTVWVLPKGRTGKNELAQARQGWQGRFEAQPSITDEDAVIVVATGVAPRGSA